MLHKIQKFFIERCNVLKVRAKKFSFSLLFLLFVLFLFVCCSTYKHTFIIHFKTLHIMKRIDLENAIVNALKEMNDNQLRYIWNEYEQYGDWYIYEMDEFDEIFYGKKPLEIVQMLKYGDFNPYHDFFGFDGLGNLESFDFIEHYSRFDYMELVNYLIDNEEVLNDDYGLDKYLDWEVIEALENEEVEE